MHYEEQVIDGFLCWRSTPDGQWKRFTQRELTERLLEARGELMLRRGEIALPR